MTKLSKSWSIRMTARSAGEIDRQQPCHKMTHSNFNEKVSNQQSFIWWQNHFLKSSHSHPKTVILDQKWIPRKIFQRWNFSELNAKIFFFKYISQEKPTVVIGKCSRFYSKIKWISWDLPSSRSRSIWRNVPGIRLMIFLSANNCFK